MTVRGRRLFALAVSTILAAGTVAGCSNHSGLRRLRSTDGASVASSGTPGPSGPGGPSGVAGPGSSGARSSPASASPTTSAAATPSTTSSHGRSRHAPSGGSHSATRAATGPTTTRPAPPAPPSAAASPSSGLTHGQHVEVTGAHFGADVRVDVDECRSDLTYCTGYADVAVRTSARGSFATSYTVSSVVALNFCGAKGCVLRIRPAGGNPLAVPIGFR